MRIRTYRTGDLPTLVHLQQTAALIDGSATIQEAEMVQLLAGSLSRTGYNIFLITDDDDELNTWGQGEGLNGVEGEVAGYTFLQMLKDRHAYHFRCNGTVLPEYRRRGAGYALLLCTMNHARIQSLDVLTNAHQQGLPLYFEALLPMHDPSSAHLARLFEMEKTDETSEPGLDLYRTEL